MITVAARGTDRPARPASRGGSPPDPGETAASADHSRGRPGWLHLIGTEAEAERVYHQSGQYGIG
ncbi:hypothetical protein AB0G15_30020 [Streptosporangium sp. NPDC023825]|uniref:hypothetical protein n=1 Tax=Streptosporangium sp. NPDC023825 TaxID=3154909 RepID=UPI003435DEA0